MNEKNPESFFAQRVVSRVVCSDRCDQPAQ